EARARACQRPDHRAVADQKTLLGQPGKFLRRAAQPRIRIAAHRGCGRRFQRRRHRLPREAARKVQRQMIETDLGRCVASFYPGATGVTAAAKLSGGASQETWTCDIVHPSGNVGAILRRAPPGYGVSPSPSRAPGLEAEAVLMQLAYDAGLPSPRVLHVLKPEEGLGRGFIMVRVEGET